jgi:ribosomal protein S18 acetylase RimI-like enzyme
MAGRDSLPQVELRRAESATDLGEAATLFREYAATLGVDLCFQNFDAEVASLPGAYGPEAGCLLLAFVSGELGGCGAFRPFTGAGHSGACEMKRLYVRPMFRRYGLGRLLAEALLTAARRAGYASMLLDTLGSMAAAQQLYASLGFAEIAPYYRNPFPDVHYLKAHLT